MLKKLFASFKKTASPRLEDIPKYPPLELGIPAVAVEDLLRSQQEIISQIRQTTRYGKEHYEQWYLPAIKRYAYLVHLLPASEAHHHRGAGGLFRHGLEVAYYALDIITNYGGTIAMDKVGEQRRNIIPRWELACFLAGMMHDIGKIVTDMQIRDKTGTYLWSPYDDDLLTWMKNNKIDRYHLRFKSDRARHKEHEQLGGTFQNDIISKEQKNYLNEGGDSEISSKMLATINGTASGRNIIYEYVQRADQKSVEKDLKANYGSSNSISSVVATPVERHIIDAMRRLLRSGEWHVNKPGSRAWVIDKELYIVWLKGAEDITHLLAKDKVPGIPRDPDSLADILIERNIATGCMVEGYERRYWWIAPDVLQQPKKVVSLRVLKISDGEHLIDPLPSSTAGRLLDRSPSEEKNGIGSQKTEDIEQDTPPAAPDTPPPAPKPVVTEEDLLPAEKKPASTVKLPDIPTQPDLFSIRAQDPADAELILPKTSEQKAMPQTDPATGCEQRPSNREIKSKNITFTIVSDQPTDKTRAATKQQEMKRSRQGKDQEQYDWANQYFSINDAGRLIHAIAEDMIQGRTPWGARAIRVGSDQVALRYPESFSEHGQNPSEMIKQIEEACWLELDPVNFIKKVRQVDGFTGKINNPTNALVLEKEASEAFFVIAGTPPQQSVLPPGNSKNPRKRMKATSPPPDRSDVQPPRGEPPTLAPLEKPQRPKQQPTALLPDEKKEAQRKNEPHPPPFPPTRKVAPMPVQDEPHSPAIKALAGAMKEDNSPFNIIMIDNVPHIERKHVFDWFERTYKMTFSQINGLTTGSASPLIVTVAPGHKDKLIRLRPGRGE